jgi:hypothetical protein
LTIFHLFKLSGSDCQWRLYESKKIFANYWISDSRKFSRCAVCSRATNALPLTFVRFGGNLTISRPADHQGLTLQYTTNSLKVGLNPTNAWYDVGGSANVTSVTIPINTNTPTAFYRVRN